MQEALRENMGPTRQRIYTMLSSVGDFGIVGTPSWTPSGNPGSYDSFEAVHDNIHGLVGGENYGNMAVVVASAFDPVFWFHHA